MDFISSFLKGKPKEEGATDTGGGDAEANNGTTSEIGQNSENNGQKPTNPDDSPATESASPVKSRASSQGSLAELQDDGPKAATTEERKSSVVAGISVDLEEVSQKAITSAKSFGSFLYNFANKAGKTVSDTAKQVKKTVEEKSILGDFNKEQEDFLKSKQNADGSSDELPWVGCDDEEKVKQEILGLSEDKRNFLRSPPTGVQFQYDYNSVLPVATKLLEIDSKLKDMRFELVPKLVNEENFWRNYFYRVSLIKQSTHLKSFAQDTDETVNDLGGSTDTESYNSRQASTDGSVKDYYKDDAEGATDSPVHHEFVSDAYGSGKISEKDLRSGMKQLGIDEKESNDDEWEKELQQELQEFEVVTKGTNSSDDPEWESEIQQMLDADSNGTKK